MANNTIKIVIQAKDDASATLKATADSFKKSMAQISAVGDGMADFGASASKYVTLPLVGAGTAAVHMAGDFEQSLNVLQSVTMATTEQMALMSDQAKALGKDVTLPGISARDAALAMNELAKAGLSVNDTMSAAKGVLSLAKAGQVETAFAAEVTANALNAFSLAGTEASNVADMLAGGANGSSASIQDLALGMQMASAGAATLKMPIGDLISALGLMSNNAIKGSDAGTSLKTFMNSLTPVTERQTNAMEAMNLKFFDAKGRFVGLRDASRQLQEGTKKMTDEQKIYNMEAAFGSDAMRAAMVLSKEGAAGYDKLSAAVGRQGAATELAAAQNRGFNGALDNLKSTVETAMVDIGSTLLPALTRSLKSLAEEVSSATEWFNRLSSGQQDLLIKTVAMVAAIGPAAFAIGKLIKVVVALGIAVRSTTLFILATTRAIVGAIAKTAVWTAQAAVASAAWVKHMAIIAASATVTAAKWTASAAVSSAAWLIHLPKIVAQFAITAVKATVYAADTALAWTLNAIRVSIVWLIHLPKLVAGFVATAAQAVVHAAVTSAAWTAAAAKTSLVWLVTELPKIVLGFITTSASATVHAAVASGAWVAAATRSAVAWVITELPKIVLAFVVTSGAAIVHAAIASAAWVSAAVTASASFSALRLLLATPLVLPAIVIAAALASINQVWQAIQSVRQAISDLNAAKESAANYDKAKASTHKTLLDLSKNGTPAQKERANKLLSQGYADGGFTGRGAANEIAGVVHKGEYVVPKSQVNQSTGVPKQGGVTIQNLTVVGQGDSQSLAKLVVRQIGFKLATA
jgi:TP901 family phage tail tape measure protein